MWYRNTIKSYIKYESFIWFPITSNKYIRHEKECFMWYPKTENNMSNTRRRFFFHLKCKIPEVICQPRKGLFFPVSKHWEVIHQHEEECFTCIPTLRRVEKTRRSRGFSRPTQGFCGSDGWTGVTYDWSMVSKVIHWPIIACIFHSTYPRNLCAES